MSTTGNDQLRAALQAVGLQPDDLGEIVEVDVKAVRRWLGGMAPYPRHRGRVARALDTTEHALWPDLAITPPDPPATTASPATSDLIAGYPSHYHALWHDASTPVEAAEQRDGQRTREPIAVPNVAAAEPRRCRSFARPYLNVFPAVRLSERQDFEPGVPGQLLGRSMRPNQTPALVAPDRFLLGLLVGRAGT